MTINLLDLTNLGQALNSLDTFKFTGDTLIKLSKNLRVAREHLVDVEFAKQQILRDNKDTPDKAQEEWSKLLKTTTDADFIKIKTSDLNLDVNQIPASTVTSLLVLLED